jgi:integrase
MTGWRIGSMLALRWEDVDLDGAKVVSRYEDNKGGRDHAVPIHELIVQHLQRLKSFQPGVFPWFHGRRQLYDEFAKLQNAASVRPEGRKEVYGFHDLRMAFATMNADRLTPDALQVLMQHKDYQTTQRYIAIGRQLNPAVADVFVPPVPALANKKLSR